MDRDLRRPLNDNKHPLLSTKKIVCVSCLGVFGLAFFIVAFFIPMLVTNLVDSQLEDKVIMTESNSNLWAKLPGDSGVDLMRIVTLYQPKNMMDVIFRGSKPEFLELPSVYSLVQKQEYVDRKFSDDGNTVQCNKFTTFDEKTEGNKQYEVINPTLLGGWHLGKTLPQPKLAWMTVGQVLQNLVEQLPLNLFYMGFHFNLLKTEAEAMAVLQSVEDETKRAEMWSDKFMGLSNMDTMENWVRAALEGNDYGVASQKIKDYFDISQTTMSAINQNFRAMESALNTSAFPYYKCNPYGQKEEDKKEKYTCDGKYLTTLQWSSSGITGNPPPGMGIPAAPSVIYTNSTLHDFIEIAFYYNYFFKTYVKDYGALVFDLDWAYEFLNREYDYPTKPQMMDDFRLQHKGNVEYIYQMGEVFDKSGDLQDLKEFQQRFKIESLQHAHVVLMWLRQMETNFAKRVNKGGSLQQAALGIFASEGLYYRYQNLTHYLLPELISSIVFESQDWKDCDTMITESIEDTTKEQVDSICADEPFHTISKNTIKGIIKLCQFDGYGNDMTAFAVKHKLDNAQKMQFCDAGTLPKQFQTLITAAHLTLHNHYKCKYERCSKQELAIKQWARSDVTNNPPTESKLPKTLSVNTWDPIKFPAPFEYGYFSVEYADIFTVKPQVLTDEESKLTLHFKGILNPLALTTAFTMKTNNQQAEFTALYQFKEFDHLLHYVRFVAIQGTFGGATTKKTPKELFFGYSDTFGQDMKSRDPAGGGDQGINSWVKLGDANMIADDAKLFPQTFKTGKSSNLETRQLVDLSDYDHAMYNYTYFDGNKVVERWDNPWNVNEDITKSTDGVIFHPSIKSDEQLSIYIPQIFRTVHMAASEGPEIFGLETVHLESHLDNFKKSPDYNSKWDGTTDLSKVMAAPTIVSLPHYYKADAELADSVSIVNEAGGPIKGNDYDLIYANVESYSGAPLQAVIQIMISMTIEKDELFVFTKSPAALPLVTLYNSGNFSESSADEQFGQLRLGLKMKSWGWYIVLGLGALLLFSAITIVGHAFYKRNKVEDDN